MQVDYAAIIEPTHIIASMLCIHLIRSALACETVLSINLPAILCCSIQFPKTLPSRSIRVLQSLAGLVCTSTASSFEISIHSSSMHCLADALVKDNVG